MARPKKQEATPSAAPTSSSAAPPNTAADAFHKVEAEITALTPDELVPLTLDVSAAVTAVLAAAPKIREHREAIVEELPKHPVAHLDNLESYALATYYTQIVHTYASADPEAAKNLIEEAGKLREGLLIAAEALAHRGLLDTDVVVKIKKGSGTSDTAGDLVALASLFSANWGKVNSKTAVERHEIDRAAELGPAVMVAVALRKQGNKKTDTEGQRARAFTLLTRAYDNCRRALAYLRWRDGDAESIAPSLYKKKPGRKPGSKKDEGEGQAGPEIEATGEGAAEELTS
jgi:hypothetical protein